MIGLLCFVLAVLALPFKSKLRLEAENAALRHQLIVLRRKRKVASGSRTKIAGSLIQPYRWFPSILKVLTIIRPSTRWHRVGFRCPRTEDCGLLLVGLQVGPAFGVGSEGIRGCDLPISDPWSAEHFHAAF